jgi:hypothetical protein
MYTVSVLVVVPGSVMGTENKRSPRNDRDGPLSAWRSLNPVIDPLFELDDSVNVSE